MSEPAYVTVSFSGGTNKILPLTSEVPPTWYIENDGGKQYLVLVVGADTILSVTDVITGGAYFLFEGPPDYAEGPLANESVDIESWGGTATIDYTEAPGKAINPTPDNEDTGITLDAVSVSWENGGSATSYNVYTGTLSGSLSLVESGVVDTTYDLVADRWPSYGQTRYWRIDSVNDIGVTEGDEWYFTTLVFSPPLSSGLSLDSEEGGNPGDDPTPTGTLSGENNMSTIKRLIIASRNTIFYEDI